MRLKVPLVVVPNSLLHDNHQKELATELQKQGYVVASDVKYAAFDFCALLYSANPTRLSYIPQAVSEAETLRSRLLAWPPGPAEQQKPTLEQVMSDELGFVD